MTITKVIESKLDIFEKKPILALTIIVLIGTTIRLFFTEWNLPTNSFDGYLLVIEGLHYANNDFSNFSNRFLWPIFLSVFFRIFYFDTYAEYVNLAKILSIIISVTTIPIIYGISKEFINKKYAIIAAGFFIIEPNLVENSIFGITEGLFIFFGLLSFYCIIQNHQKYQFLAFVFAGLAFDTRLNGIVLLILIFISFFLRIQSQSKRNFIIGVMIFGVIIFPAHFLIPIQSGTEIFPIIGNTINAVTTGDISYSTYESSEDTSSNNLIQNAIKNEFMHIFRISIPFLIVLFPFGMIISLKNLNFQKKMLFFAIIVSLLIAIPQYTMSNEYRNLFFLIPFFCIFAGVGIQEIVKNVELKNIFLILLLMGLIILSVGFLRERYVIDQEYYLEKDRFGNYITTNFEGNITGDFRLEIIRNISNLKTGSSFFNDNIAFVDPGKPIDSIPKLEKFVKENEIKYLIIEFNSKSNHFPVFREITSNEENFPFLEKMVESNELNYAKLNAKIFKINFKESFENNDFIKN